MKISTKTGDKGETSLFGGQRVKKTSFFMEVLGTLDELNSFLGLAKSGFASSRKLKIKRDFAKLTEKIQYDIYKIMSVVGNQFRPIAILLPVWADDIAYLENKIENFEGVCGKLDKFVSPGASEISARLHVTRSVCRRAERAFIKLIENLSLEDDSLENSHDILKYLNRLSDLLFLMAILTEK